MDRDRTVANKRELHLHGGGAELQAVTHPPTNSPRSPCLPFAASVATVPRTSGPTRENIHCSVHMSPSNQARRGEQLRRPRARQSWLCQRAPPTSPAPQDAARQRLHAPTTRCAREGTYRRCSVPLWWSVTC
jgi:hypothetical protein